MRLRRRLAFHFTYQLIAFSAFMFCFLIVLLFFLIKHISEDEIKRNFPTGVLNSIVTETVTENGEVLAGTVEAPASREGYVVASGGYGRKRDSFHQYDYGCSIGVLGKHLA